MGLFEGAGADDGGRDRLILQHPRDGDVGGFLTQLAAQVLPRLDLAPVLFQLLLDALARPAPLILFFQYAAEQTAREWRPGESRPRRRTPTRGDHFQFDVAVQQVIDALFADKSEEIAPLCCLVRLRDMPTREVGRADIQHFPLLNRALAKLPYLIPEVSRQTWWN